MSRITIVEDDPYLREELLLTFQRKGYSVSGISSFAAPEAEILASAPDLVILDVHLPGKSGFALCKWLKARASFPILILTAMDTLGDELTALGLGADDFLTKPCHPERLLARAARLLQTYGQVKNVIQCGELSLDTDTCKLVWRETCKTLPDTEGRILRLLMEKHPQLVTRGELFAAVWGGDAYLDENILQVNMTRLRRKLAEIGLEDSIRTVRGCGYQLEVPER